MKISTKGRYALVIMAYLARKYETGGYITLKEISDNENISLKYLEKIISLLNKANLVETQRGANGGYKLNKKPEEYTLLEIIEASEGKIKTVECTEETICTKKDTCSSRKIWCELNLTIDTFFENKTLKDIM